MLTEPLPIAIYVKRKTRDPSVLAITQNWRVEPTVIEAIIIAHFEELGVFSVEPFQDHVCFEALMNILRDSPEIYKQLKKADELEAKRRKDRHTD